MPLTDQILAGIEGLLRGTVSAQSLKRQLQDRKESLRRESLQTSILESQFAESQKTPNQRLAQAGVLQPTETLPEGVEGPVQLALPEGSQFTEADVQRFRLGQRLPSATEIQQRDALQRRREDPLGIEQRTDALDLFKNVLPSGEGPIFTPEQIGRFKLTGQIPSTQRLSPSRQFPFKTPEGQFVATLSPEGEKTNETRLGDLPPTTRSLLGGIDLADFPSLDGGDIVSVQAAIKRILGTRSARDAPTIRRFLGMMAGGATIADIEDRLLTEQTSLRFTGPIRNAFEFVTRSGLSKDQRDTNRDALDRILETQDVEAGKEFLLAIARDKGTAQERNQVRGRDEALLALDAIEDLILVKTATGPLRGRLQRIQARFTGLAGDERLALLDQEIALAVIDYRQAKSGAAFTESEERLYERIFPSIQNSSKLNLVKIESLRTTFRRNQRAFYIRGLGKRNYLDLFGNEDVPGRETQQQTDPEPSIVPDETQGPARLGPPTLTDDQVQRIVERARADSHEDLSIREVLINSGASPEQINRYMK